MTPRRSAVLPGRARKTLGLASATIILARLLVGAFGLEVHTSVLSGMPLTAASWVIGPSVVLLHLAAWTVAPILLIALLLDAAYRACTIAACGR